MTVSAGSRLGPYEIVSPLGAGGMGEVYRARDPRLGREVALKVLPEEVSRDPSRLSRFEQEARAASALNHPNIITIYEIGKSDATAYIAMELVEGKTLRELTLGGPLSLRKVVSLAAQTAEGLAKAHAAGIVHRDLKPENLMVSRDGYVKILDFGLSKLVAPESGALSEVPTAVLPETHPGTVLGTVAYMSPEQARGEPVDLWSDQFSFGSILYEAATGQRAFSRATTAETMSAIIREEPDSLTKLRPGIPPPLRWIIERCHAKNPEERYVSTRDLARDLESLRDHITEVSGAAEAVPAAAGREGRRVISLAAGIALVALALLAGWAARSLWKKATPSAPSFHRLTFRRGYLGNARFTPDGQSIIYGAQWEGEPVRVYMTRPESPESRPFDFGKADADILSISSSGEMAILLYATDVGTLARVPLAGGVPRQIAEGIPYAGADWDREGKQLAIVREVNGKNRLEYPIGNVLYETPAVLASPRFSPRGDRLAFYESDPTGATSVVVMEISEKERKTLSSGWKRFYSGVPCWTPAGEEVWFTAPRRGEAAALYAASLSGRQRQVARVPGDLELYDISRDGRVLLGHHTRFGIVMGRSPGEPEEHDLAWLDFSIPVDLSADGKVLVFTENGEGSGAKPVIYLRKTDGSSPLRVGEGQGIALSPDGNWVLAAVQPEAGRADQLVLLPTGPGESRIVKTGALQSFGGAAWTADGKRLVFSAAEKGRRSRVFVQDAAPDASLRAISPEGVEIKSAGAVSPDGRLVVGMEGAGKASLYPLDGGQARPVVGLEPEDRPIQWSADGRSLYVHNPGRIPNKVWLLDPASGRKRTWMEIKPGDPGIRWLQQLLISRDGKSYVYGAWRATSELYLVEGLR